MSQSKKLLQPKYFSKFQCIGSHCEDTCCSGMGVVIDKETYDKYQHCDDSELKTKIEQTIQITRRKATNATYAQIALSNMTCPFLSEQRLCEIQTKLGEDALSRTCATYPRALSLVDGVFEQTLYMSCPEAVRLALLNPNKMQFDELEDAGVQFREAPELNTPDPNYPDKPYPHFWDIRSLIVSLLQNRTYRVWERVVILGLFCDQLNALVAEGRNDTIADLIATYSRNITERIYTETLANIAVNQRLQLDFFLQVIENRLMTDYTSPRFLDCYDQAMQGIQYTCESLTEDAVVHYTKAHSNYYLPFMDQHEYILENYLVNYVFKNLFPFGPQKSLYHEQKSIASEFTMLAIHYAIVRSFLVGMAGYHKLNFGTGHIVKTIQSFAKTIEHDLGFLKQIVQFLEDNNVNNLAFLAILAKDSAHAPLVSASQLPLRFAFGKSAKIFSAASVSFNIEELPVESELVAR